MLYIRRETPADYQTVEDVIRRAFYNVYVPGCTEHYLAHIMRGHEDFVPELDFVAELDGQIIGSILYTRARLTDERGEEKPVLTFGPVCIAPDRQRQGYGKQLIEHSMRRAAALGHDVIVIFGNPFYYTGVGFQSCKKHNICLENGKFPSAMMVKLLRPDALDGRKWHYGSSRSCTSTSGPPGASRKRWRPWSPGAFPVRKRFPSCAIPFWSEADAADALRGLLGQPRQTAADRKTFRPHFGNLRSVRPVYMGKEMRGATPRARRVFRCGKGGYRHAWPCTWPCAWARPARRRRTRLSHVRAGA